MTLRVCTKAGLEKLTNANRSVSTVNDRLFQVELAEIADWTSLSEYMLGSNFGQTLIRVIGWNFGAYTFILPFSLFPKYLSTFLVVLSMEKNLNKIKIIRNYRELTRVDFEWLYSNSVSEVVLNAAAKSSCFNVRVTKNKNNNKKKN